MRLWGINITYRPIKLAWAFEFCIILSYLSRREISYNSFLKPFNALIECTPCILRRKIAWWMNTLSRKATFPCSVLHIGHHWHPFLAVGLIYVGPFYLETISLDLPGGDNFVTRMGFFICQLSRITIKKLEFMLIRHVKECCVQFLPFRTILLICRQLLNEPRVSFFF